MFNVFSDALDFIEGLFTGTSTATASPSIPEIGTAAETFLATAQAVLAVTENVANLGPHTAAINKAVSDAQGYAAILATEPTGDNVDALAKAVTDVVAATPAGKIHNILAAASAAVTVAVGLYEQAHPLTAHAATASAPSLPGIGA